MCVIQEKAEPNGTIEVFTGFFDFFVYLFTCLRWQFQDQTRFEEFMARHAEESQDELQTLKSLNVFYQVRLGFVM